MAMRYQSSAKKSNRKFEVVGARQLAVHLPLPLVELWEELQLQVEHLAGLAGLQIIRGVIEEEVTRRVGPRYQPDPASSCVRWGSSQAMWCLPGRKWRWSVRGCGRGKARKWRWTVTRGCNTTGVGSEL